MSQANENNQSQENLMRPSSYDTQQKGGQVGTELSMLPRVESQNMEKTLDISSNQIIQERMEAEQKRQQAMRDEHNDCLDINVIDDTPSYIKLMKHINSIHPRKVHDGEYTKFGICDDIGSYPLCCGKQKPVSNMAKNIGLGPTLFLISAKSLAWFFLILTILNIPVYMFFYKSNQTATCADPQGCFQKLSLGSIGQSEIACATLNFAKSREIELSCHTNNAKLTEIKMIGIAKDDESSCKKLNKATYSSKGNQFYDTCYINNLDADKTIFAQNTDQTLFDKAQQDKFLEYYNKNCLDKASCNIPIDAQDGFTGTGECYEQLLDREFHSKHLTEADKAKLDVTKSGKFDSETEEAAKAWPEPIILLESYCVQDSVIISAFGESREVFKNTFGFVVIFSDFIMIALFAFFIYRLDKQQQEYAQLYQDQTIEMNDFCLKFVNIPKDYFFQGNEQVLKAKLWRQMTDILQEMSEIDDVEFNINDTKFQIVDINFAKTDLKDVEILFRLNKVRTEIKGIQRKQTKYQESGRTQEAGCCSSTFELQLEKKQEKYDKIKQEFFDITGNTNKSAKFTGAVVAQETIDEQKLLEFESDKQSIIYTFITFRSMDGAQMVKKAYNYTKCDRFWINLCGCCCSDKYKRLQRLYIGDNWPAPQEAILPENILWQNMAYSNFSRFIRRLIVALIIIITLIVSFYSITQMQGLKNNTEGTEKDDETVKMAKNCPLDVTKQQAYDDQQLPLALQTGLMGCYCFENTIKKFNTEFQDTKFTDIDPTNNSLYCKTWLETWFVEQVVKYGAPAIIAIINAIVSNIFKYTAPFEKQYTMNDETSSTFTKLTILQFINVAIILLIQSIKIQSPVLNAFNIFNGQYGDFDMYWYTDIGAQLCFTLFLNTITPHISKIIVAWLSYPLRCLDRSCKLSVFSKDDSGIGKPGDKVNTKKVLQTDVDKQYTGQQIEAYFVYAQYFTNLWAILAYSGGMPVLYPIAVVNFMFLYWIYKMLIIKQYQKTTTFNQDLPFLSIYFMKVGLVIHIVWTVFMFTETQLLQIDLTKVVGAFSPAYAKKYDAIREELLAGIGQEEVKGIISAERFTSGVGILYLAWLIILTVLWLLRTTLFHCLGKVCGAILERCPCGSSNKVGDDQEHGIDTHSVDFLADLRVETLQDKYRKSVVDYHDVQQYEVSENNMMNKELKDALLDMMKRRLKWIESAIDVHVSNLIEEIMIKPTLKTNEKGGKASNDQIQVYLDLRFKSFDQKLLILLRDESYLMQRKNRLHEQYLRMKGITQSYYLYDSLMYKPLKPLLMDIRSGNVDQEVGENHEGACLIEQNEQK